MKKIILHRFNDDFYERPPEIIMDVTNIKFEQYDVIITTQSSEIRINDDIIDTMAITDED